MTEQNESAAGGQTLVQQLEDGIDAVLRGEKTFAEVCGFGAEYIYEVAGMGYRLLQEGNYDDAETIFRGLIQLNDKDPNLHMWLGSTLHRRGEIDQAIESYSAALELAPNHATCLANRGELLIVKGDAKAGTKDLIKATTESDPEAKNASTVRARAILATIAQKLKDNAKEKVQAE